MSHEIFFIVFRMGQKSTKVDDLDCSLEVQVDSDDQKDMIPVPR